MNVAVITTTRIFREGQPILLVTHDEDDGAWQLLDGGGVICGAALVAGLGEVARHDPTVLLLADLPLGWRAWRPSPDIT